MHRDAPVRYHHVADADPGETRGPLAGGSFLAEFVDSRRHGGYAAMRFAPAGANIPALLHARRGAAGFDVRRFLRSIEVHNPGVLDAARYWCLVHVQRNNAHDTCASGYKVIGGDVLVHDIPDAILNDMVIVAEIALLQPSMVLPGSVRADDQRYFERYAHGACRARVGGQRPRDSAK